MAKEVKKKVKKKAKADVKAAKRAKPAKAARAETATKKPERKKRTPKVVSMSQATAMEHVLLNFKASRADKAAMQLKADRFTKGNLSRWMRRAGLHYVPKKKTQAEAA